MTDSRITPGEAPRLLFAVYNSDDSPVEDFDHTGVSSAAFALFAGRVRTAGDAIVVSGTVADTVAHSTGQIVTVDASLGLYALDAPVAAANVAYDLVQPVIVPVDSSLQIYPADHVIDQRVDSRSSHNAAAVVSAMQAVANDFKASGFSTHDAAAVVSAMQAVANDFKASGFSTHNAAAVVSAMQAVANDFKATGFSTHNAAAVVSAMQAVADDFKATGFSTHNAAAVVSAMQAVANDFKASGFSTHNAADVWAAAERTLTAAAATEVSGYASGQSPAEALVQFFATTLDQTEGGTTILKLWELMAAALLGLSSEDDDSETFQFANTTNDAFTVTFDATTNQRTNVELAE